MVIPLTCHSNSVNTQKSLNNSINFQKEKRDFKNINWSYKTNITIHLFSKNNFFQFNLKSKYSPIQLNLKVLGLKT